jgi:hypothetical protein
MGSVFGGGGGGGSSAPTPDTTTQFIREAPGIEERKLELMDLARQTAQTPISIPDIQVQQLSPLEQAAITQAGVTGVGSQAVGQAITGTQASMGAPNISQFYNPYQSYVLDEINRQAQMKQQGIADQAILSGAFGGGREGVQRAELQRGTLDVLGRAQQTGFNTALQAAQQQQAAERAGAAQLGNLGQIQQTMAGTDIQRQLAAGGLQRQIAQAQLDATRQTQLQRSAEPLQRLEFLSNIYAAGPKSTSGITAATTPQSSPLAQSLGAGLAAYNAYGLNQATSNPAGNTALSYAPKGFNKGGIVDLAKVKKFNKGAMVSTEDDESTKLLTDQETGSVPYLSPQMRNFMMLNPIAAQLLQTRQAPGESGASAAARGIGEGLGKTQDAALSIAKYDAAVKAAEEKGKAKSSSATQILKMTGKQLGVGDADDEYFVPVTGGVISAAPSKTYDASEEAGKIRKAFDDRKLTKTDAALRDLENYIAKLAQSGQGGDLPGVGFFGGRSPITSTAGRVLRAKLASFQNIVLKERSGAAVTESELNRIVNEMAGGEVTKDEKALLSTLASARNALEQEKLEVINSFKGQKALNKYLTEEGISLYESPTFIQGAAKSSGTYAPIEGRSILDVDGKKVTFIGGVRFIFDPKRGKFYPAKDKPKLPKKNK